MKKLLQILLMFVLALPASARTYCLFAAVSNYGNEHNLQVSTDDAKRMYKLYKSKGASVCLLTSKNATSDSIVYYIKKMAKRCKAEDQVVFFFSGHGVDNHMVTYDMDKKLSYDTLFEELRQINCSKILVFVDACYSGSMRASKKNANDSIEYLNSNLMQHIGENEKFVLFSSSRNDEVSYEEGAMIKGGFFTNALINGLRGAADKNNDKDVTVIELFEYMHNDVARRIKQVGPQFHQYPNLTTNPKNHNVVVMTRQ